MLHEYHGLQNKKQPRSVHATYMLYGTRKTIQANGHTKSDEDVDMSSSPPEPSPLLEETPIMTLSLVPEESLKGNLLLAPSLEDYMVDKLLHTFSCSLGIRTSQVYSCLQHQFTCNQGSRALPRVQWP